MILRPATPADCDQYFEWANDPEVRAISFNEQPISYESHVSWFTNKINTQNELWVLTKSISNTTHFADTGCECECDHIPIGHIRIEKKINNTEIHFFITKQHRGEGNAKRMIQMALLQVETWPVIAQVKQSNRASRTTLDKLDFQIIATTSESITYQKMQL
jgi:RimJ/RimL family protein N-acetyltransferase